MPLFSLSDEDEPDAEEEERTEEKPEVPRDSGCFESTENLENGRDEPEPEPQTESTPDVAKEQESELSDVQEQLQDLALEEGSWTTEPLEQEYLYNLQQELLLWIFCCFQKDKSSLVMPHVRAETLLWW